MMPCDCPESKRRGARAEFRRTLIRVPFDLMNCFSNGAPEIETCVYCDRVLRSVNYGLGFEAIYPHDLRFLGEYFVDMETGGEFVALRTIGQFRPGEVRRANRVIGWDPPGYSHGTPDYEQ